MSEQIELKSSGISIVPEKDDSLWNGDWLIYLKQKNSEEKQLIGKASFAGDKGCGKIPVYVELEEAYRNRGYGTKALQMLSGWAFRNGPVYEIEAVVEHDNDMAVKALKKAGYIYRDGDRRVEQYSLIKPMTNWAGLYLIIGIFVGLILGIVFDHLLYGMLAGVIISLLIGTSMDLSAKKEREKITGKKENPRRKNKQ